MNKREELRQATIGTRNPLRKIEVEYNDHTYEFRQPTIAEREAIRQGASFAGEGLGELRMDMAKHSVLFVISQTYIPGTDEKVFEDGDFDTLLNAPTGGFVEVFMLEIDKFFEINHKAVKKT